MNLREFLELLTPPVGVLFTATPTKTGWRNVGHKSIDEAVQHINWLTFEGEPAYFSLASYAKEKYWDEAFRNQDGSLGKWRRRTQENARAIKSFFLDLDVEPGNPLKFDSKEQALTGLRAFVRKVGLPRPMVVDSGGGLHAYWPLAMAVSTDEWRPVAEQFKAICVHEGFRADRSLTSDHARVLRALGSYNTRRGAAVSLLCTTAPLSFTDFAARIEGYASQHGVAATPKGAAHQPALAGAPAGAWTGDDNLGASNDPLNFDRITFHCAQMQLQVATRGATTGEQLWRAGLGLAKFSEKQEDAARTISDGHASFSLPATIQKMGSWTTGPTKCGHFHQLNPAVCEACPHWQSLTSPAQLGRQIVQAPPPVVEMPMPDGGSVEVDIPALPTGYSRRADRAICIETEDQEGRVAHLTVCPYDLYPLAIRSQNGVDAAVDEHCTWRVHLPLNRGQPLQSRDIDVPLGLLADSRALSKLLYSKGIVLSGDQPKMTQQYMSAYLQKLAREAGREKLYERLGWHDEHTTFVMGDRVLHSDGTVKPHNANEAIRVATKNGLKSAGTLAGWQKAMQFYNRPGFAGHRFFIYASLAAPLFHMNDTGNKGAMICAGGASGRGKTTCLKACCSIWGTPDSIMVNGNREGATTNALYSHLGTMHSYPFILDDITERDQEELRRLALNISQGEGKRRMMADGTMVGRIDTWENLTLTSTNADTLTNMMAGGRDVDPHLMRLVAVEFSTVDTGTEAKIAADHFIRALGKNHGHVGPVFMGYITSHYEAIKRLYIHNVEKVDRLLASSNASAERYWSAVVAACYTAAQIASKAGLLDYPYESDLQWMIGLLTRQRESISESVTPPLEMLSHFLNSYNRNTLVISAKASSNLDNVAQRHTDELLVRHELDRHVIYISRAAMMSYCTTVHTPFRALEWQLEQLGVITKRGAQKVLGADTIYSNGQTRCWLIDATKLGGFALPSTPAQASNVVPISARTA